MQIDRIRKGRTARAPLVCAVAALCCLGAQAQDNSANSTLSGVYFIRQVALSAFDNNGNAGHARSVTGLATFDGKGKYSFTGALQYNVDGGAAKTYTASGSYSVGSTGALEMDNLLNNQDTEYGAIGAAGPSAFVASATEGPYLDMVVGIPASTNLSLASVGGTWNAGYIDYLAGDVTKVRNATFTLQPDGLGAIGTVAVNGFAANLGGTSLTQTVSGVNYAVDGSTGLGALNFGAPSDGQLIGGFKVFALSADGSILIGGDPNGYDLLVAVHPYTSPDPTKTDANASYRGTYAYGQLSNDTSNLPNASIVSSNYGRIDAYGTGSAIVYQRYCEFDLYSYDYTYDSQRIFDVTGTAQSDYYQEFLGAGGQTLITVGQGSYYTLLLGLQGKPYSNDGSGVFINPNGVRNSASHAPITNPIAPGEYVTLSGSGLAAGSFPQGGPLASPLPTDYQGVQVTVNGQKAPIYVVSPTQVAFVVPVSVKGSGYADIQVINSGVKSNVVTVSTSDVSPGVWTAAGDASGMALVRKVSDQSMVSQDNPVKPGDRIVIFCNGLGPVKPAVADGVAAGATSQTAYVAQVFVDGQEATVTFSGLAAGAVGLYQINATVPDGVTAGALVYLDVSLSDSFGDGVAYTSEAKIATAK